MDLTWSASKVQQLQQQQSLYLLQSCSCAGRQGAAVATRDGQKTESNCAVSSLCALQSLSGEEEHPPSV